MSLLAQGLALGVLTGGLYALLASGLSLYFGVMRVVMVAHPAFLFLAAYLTYTAHTVFGVDPFLAAGYAAYLHVSAAEVGADGAPVPASGLMEAIPDAIRHVRGC